MIAKKVKSIRRSLLISIVGFTCAFMVFALLFTSNLFIKESQKQISDNAMSWANIAANFSIEFLNVVDVKSYENRSALYHKLSLLSSAGKINNIDIYSYDRVTGNYDFVVAFDNLRSNFDNLDDGPFIQFNQALISQLKQPKIGEDFVELVIDIQYNNNVIGYLYMQVDLSNKLKFDTQLTLTIILLFAVLLIAVFFITYRLEQEICSPMREITSEIQHIAQSKKFEARLEEMPYQEIDILARNINVLLGRTEKHIAKLDEAEQHSLKLNSELEDKVSKRTDALKESNQELLSTLEKLHQFQDQLVESEKMASLGDMVAGVAHEVNTPIGLGVTASTLLSDRLTEIQEAFNNKTLRSSQLKKFISEGQENVGIIYRNLKRAAELISSFKKVAVDQSSEEIREFNIYELINEVLLTLAPQIKNTPYEIDIDCPESLVIRSKPGPINQVLINLILNSIIHGFEGRSHGKIKITVMLLSEQLNIIYKDDGKGMDENIKNKVFDPFTTTKRGEGGSGLGMHLVYNLVTQALGGSIGVDSMVGHGVHFEINFPLDTNMLTDNY